jgi:hypothetical protein
MLPPAATSSTRMATRSQPRTLLPIARLNMARSRARFSIWSFVRIDQACQGRSDGLPLSARVPAVRQEPAGEVPTMIAQLMTAPGAAVAYAAAGSRPPAARRTEAGMTSSV